MKKLVALILTVILAVGAIFMVGCGNSNNGGDQTANSGSGGSSSSGSDQTQQVTTYPGVRSVRLSMGAMSETEATTTSTGEQTEAYSERTIVATILPTSALQQEDFTMTWQSNGSSEGIDEYLTLTQETDGSPKAVVRCTKDFSAKGAILITATARAGGLSDTLTATFLGVTRDFDLSYDSSYYDNLVLMNSEERGEYYMFNYGCLDIEFEVDSIDFYGDTNCIPVDVEFSASDTYVYVLTSLENVTEYETVLKINLRSFATQNFYEISDMNMQYVSELGRKKSWISFTFNSGFFDGYRYGLEYVKVNCGSTGDVAIRGLSDEIVPSQKYTIVDYDLAVTNDSIAEGVVGTYLGSEVMAMSEQALNEAYYELRVNDPQSKLTKTFRLWGRLPATSVDTGSDIIF